MDARWACVHNKSIIINHPHSIATDTDVNAHLLNKYHRQFLRIEAADAQVYRRHGNGCRKKLPTYSILPLKAQRQQHQCTTKVCLSFLPESHVIFFPTRSPFPRVSSEIRGVSVIPIPKQLYLASALSPIIN